MPFVGVLLLEVELEQVNHGWRVWRIDEEAFFLAVGALDSR